MRVRARCVHHLNQRVARDGEKEREATTNTSTHGNAITIGNPRRPRLNPQEEKNAHTFPLSVAGAFCGLKAEFVTIDPNQIYYYPFYPAHHTPGKLRHISSIYTFIYIYI